MDISERILDLDRVKVQLLISWLSHQDLVKLIKSSDQDVEDYILDNISRDGRKILLDYVGLTLEDFDKRSAVRKKANKIFFELVKETGKVLKGSERKALQRESLKQLSKDELEIWQSRNRGKEIELEDALRKEIEGHLERIDKGRSLKA